MALSYSIYNAKAKFSEVIRLAKANKRVLITERGTPVAEVIPCKEKVETFEERLARLEKEGVVIPASNASRIFKPVVKRPGALKRFLESRNE